MLPPVEEPPSMQVILPSPPAPEDGSDTSNETAEYGTSEEFAIVPIETISPVGERRAHSHFPVPIRAALGVAEIVAKKLADPTILSVFQHYIDFTCPSLDPGHLDLKENNSAKYFLPVAVNSLTCFYALLALSGMQLREGNPSYSESAVRHRSLSFHHLNQDIQNKKDLRHPAVLAGILCQLTLDVMEGKSDDWQFHLNVCRNTVKQLLSKPGNYVAYRIAKYDTFAALIDGHKPIIGLKVFEDELNNQHLDSIWTIPTRWVVYCATATYWGKLPESPEKLMELAYIEAQFSQFRPFLYNPLDSLNKNVHTMWQIATFIHYTRIIALTRLDLVPEISSTFSTAMLILQAFPCSDFRGTAFTWPFFVLASAAFTAHDRENLRVIITRFWRSLRITTFGQLLGITQSLWAADHTVMSAAQYNAHVQSHLTILLA